MKSVLTLIIWAAFLAGCAPPLKGPGGHPGGVRVSSNWSADRVSIKCEGAHCRPQVGILAYLETRTDGTLLHRCTATLIGASRVLSNYHCILAGQVGYFILPSGVRRIAGVRFKTYAGLDRDHNAIVAPDAVVLDLDQPFNDVPPLFMAQRGDPTATSFGAVVSNQGASETEYRMDLVTCTVGRHPTKFPYDLRENPDLIVGLGCRSIPGNSGSPMFAAGDDRIQAVIQMSTTDPEGMIYAANARCLSPNAKCISMTPTEINRRVNLSANTGTDEMTALGAATRATFPTDMRLTRLRLSQLLDGHEAYEIVDLPRCVRAGVTEIPEIKFLNQLVAIGPEGRVTEVRRREITGRVSSRYKNYFVIEVSWPPPFAPLLSPEKHPSQRPDLVSPIKIEIPGCAY